MRRIFKKIFPWLILAFVLRLILMPISFHSDIWTVSFSQYLFAFKGVTNIYDYLATLSSDSTMIVNYGRNFFTYPPLAYFTLGIFGFILKPFFSSNFLANLADNLPNILSDGRLYWHLFLTKFPYLFFDFGILFLLVGMFDEERKKILAAILWLFNPLVLYTSYMVGQFDIIPVFFSLLALYLIKKRKMFWGAFALGMGGAYEMYPLFFLPFLAINEGKDLKDKMKLFLLGLLPYLVSIMPFLGSPAFRQTVLFSNQSQKMLFAKINVSGAEYLSLFVVFYIFLLGFCWLKKIDTFGGGESQILMENQKRRSVSTLSERWPSDQKIEWVDLWKWFLLVMLLFFGLTHYHPQWFLWISPFLIIYLISYPKYKLFPLFLILSWLGITLFFESSLSLGLFKPIWPQLEKAKSLSETLPGYIDVYLLKSLFRSIFAGISLAISISLLRQNENV